MADENDSEESAEAPGDETDGEGEDKSFRERVEEIRERRAEEGEGEGDPRERMEEMMGGGGGGPGGMGGNPFAQMMGGMMGGGGPGGMGGPRGQESAGDEELTREVRQLRDEVRDVNRNLERIAEAIEDD